MLRVFLKDSLIYTISGTISRGLGLFLVPFYTRVLSPADYGSLDLITVIAGIVNLTVALEVSQGVARFYSAEQDLRRKIAYASSAFWFAVVSHCIFAGLALLLTNQLAHLVTGQIGLEGIFQLGIAFICVNGVFYLVQNQFRWEMRSGEYALVSLVMSFVTTALSVWFTFGLHMGLRGVLLGMVVGCLAATFLGLWRLRNSFQFCFDSARLREMLEFSYPLVLSGIAIWVTLYIDRLMINYFLTIDDVGLYGVGYRLASMIGFVVIGFRGALTPFIYTYYMDVSTRYQLSTIFRIFLAIALPLAITLTLFAKDIMRVFVAESFYGGAVVVVYLVPAILFSQMYIFAPGISIAKKTYLIVWINLVGAVVNVLLNLALIPIIGIVGSALATLLSCVVVFVAYMFFSQQLYYVNHNWSRICCAVLLAIGISALIPQLDLSDVARWSINVVALISFFVASLAIGLVRIEELRQAEALISLQLRTILISFRR
jgi:O-antigen/teichoic acid export membrane protein